MEKKRRVHLFISIIVSIGFLFSLSSCDRVVVNSSENDELIASLANLEGGPEFQAVLQVIIPKCAGCHTHQAWYSYNEASYVAAGLVVAQNPALSKMYYRLSTSTEGPGPKNMPAGGGQAFTSEEVELMETWISSL